MKEKGDYCAKQKQKMARRRSSKEKVIVETRKGKKKGEREREIGGTRCARERKDEKDERSATRIG